MDILEQSYQVASRETDLFNQCRPSALLGFLQDLATDHAAVLNVSRELLMEKYGAFWMMVRLWFKLDRPISGGETIHIKTWHRGAKTAMVYRDFDIYSGGELIGEAVTAWVIAEYESRKMLRPASVVEMAQSAAAEKVKEKTLSRIKLPGNMERIDRRQVRYSDTDVNGHMNNVRYADVACDAIGYDRMKGRFLSEMQINFISECFAGEDIFVFRGRENNLEYIQGADQDGKSHFEIEMKLAAYL